LLKAKNENAGRDLLIANTFVEEAWRRIRRNLRQVEDNIDKQRKQVVEMVYDLNGYHWTTNV
jgi:hypothetical protein